MNKILIVSEKSSGFYNKYISKLIDSLNKDNHNFEIMLGEENDSQFNASSIINKEFSYLSKNYDEHRFLEVFKESKNNNISHIHFCRIIDPQRLYTALETSKIKEEFTISFGVFGLSEYTRRPIYAKYVEKLLTMNTVKTVLLHTIGPSISKEFCAKNDFYQSEKVSFVNDLIYEDKKDYDLDPFESKNLLNIQKKGKIILFFGAYFFSKGPDLLLEAAKELSEILDLHFLFIGDTKTASFKFTKSDYIKFNNITFIDTFINDQDAINYFIASDLIVLPYRKFYENNTSGVFVQACLAKTPLLVPNISPFKEVLEKYELGMTFKCESVKSLKDEILKFYNSSSSFKDSNATKYINSISSWDNIAKLIVN